MNEELKERNSVVLFANNLNFYSMDFSFVIFSLFDHRKTRGHRTAKIVKSWESYSNGRLPYHCSFYYVACASIHDVACEFTCAVRMRSNN